MEENEIGNEEWDQGPRERSDGPQSETCAHGRKASGSRSLQKITLSIVINLFVKE